MIISYTIIWIIITYKGRVPVYTKKAYRGVEVCIFTVYPHLALAPDVDKWSHHDLVFYPGKEFWSPLKRTAGLAPEQV